MGVTKVRYSISVFYMTQLSTSYVTQGSQNVTPRNSELCQFNKNIDGESWIFYRVISIAVLMISLVRVAKICTAKAVAYSVDELHTLSKCLGNEILFLTL